MHLPDQDLGRAGRTHALLLGLLAALLLVGLLAGAAQQRAGWVRSAKV